MDGKPKVRPMQYMVLEDEKLWFCTNSKKEVYAELQANPFVELCGCKLEKDEMQTPWIRFSAEAVFEERQDIRDAIIDKSAIVNALYKTMRDNPIFKEFYLKDIDGWRPTSVMSRDWSRETSLQNLYISNSDIQ